jgi:hypothetical protein
MRLRSLSSRWWLTTLCLLVAAVYWPGLRGGFVFDDYPNIVDNLALHVGLQSDFVQWMAAVFSSPSNVLVRPLAMLTFAINYALTGLDPYWMKLTNLGIHLLNTGLVFGLVQCLLRMANARPADGNEARRTGQALWITAAWALNPINLMAVLFVVQRMESLCHTFVFAGLWLYLLGRVRLQTDGRGWALMLIGLIGGTALGTLAKESAVLVPLYAFALEWTLLGFAGQGERRDRRLLGIYGLLLMLPGLLALAWELPRALHAGAYLRRSFSLGERLLTEGRVLVDYLHWTLLPNLSQLSLYHDDYPLSHGLLSPPSTFFAWLLLAGLLGTMVWLRKRRPLMALGLAWFFAAHLLTATIIPLELVYEHRNYFASLGLVLALADLLFRWPLSPTRRRAGVIVAIALLALYAGLTMLRAREWEDQLRFSISEAAKHPQSPRATYDVARNYILLSGYRPDSAYAKRVPAALKQAIRAPGSSTLPVTAAIIFAARTGTPLQQQWWRGLQSKLSQHPIGPQETGSLGSLVDCNLNYHCNLPRQDMVDTFLAALARGPNADVMYIYGNYALNGLQDPNLALRLWQDSAKLKPNEVQYQATLAKLMIASGRPELAAQYISRVRQLGKLGQNEQQARELELLSAQARTTQPAASAPALPP